MGKIHVLSETVQNKIAAGEVVERPASVVKELVENSLDAGAGSITVEIEEGGHRLIRVSDDGHGMDETDLVAAMQRHATSKISSVEDIFAITSFGFRGEALPSVGSVSRMAIATAVPGAAAGNELVIDGGELVSLRPAPPRTGTRIEVRDIFFNTPARRNFQHSAKSESGKTTAVLTRIALGNPEASFRFQSGPRMTLSVQPAATQLDRIRDIFGADLADKMIHFDVVIRDGLRIHGYVARPPESSRNTSFIYLLVNKRWIRSSGLFRALGDIFSGMIVPRHYPKAVVNIDVDPSCIDINVHPSKEEIRFDDEHKMIRSMRHAIKMALDNAAGVSTFHSISTPPGGESRHKRPEPEKRRPERSPKPHAEDGGQKRFDLRSSLSGWGRQDFSKLDLSSARDYIRGAGMGRDGLTGGEPAQNGFDPAPREPWALHDDAIAGYDDDPESPVGTPNFVDAALPEDLDSLVPPRQPEARRVDEETLPVGSPGTHRILGQAGGRYILVDGPDGLLLVDPHALHERYNYDRFLAAAERRTAGKKLLLPLEIVLAPSEIDAAGEAADVLAEYGFSFEFVDPNVMRITAIPSFLSAIKSEVLIKQVLSDATDARAAVESMRDRLLASLACRASVLLGRTLPEAEMTAILDRFFNKGQLPTCPHGRPTAIRITWNELDRRFGR